jgi:hypothetical protein
MRTTRLESSIDVSGRPGVQNALTSYLLAINLRCYANNVSGVTTVATCASAFRPSFFALAASRRRWSSVNRSRARRCALAKSIFLGEILNHWLLPLVQPTPTETTRNENGSRRACIRGDYHAHLVGFRLAGQHDRIFWTLREPRAVGYLRHTLIARSWRRNRWQDDGADPKALSAVSSPIPAKSLTMPANHGFGFDDD